MTVLTGNILVPLDAGFLPRVTLLTAAALANEGARLTLACVVDIPSGFWADETYEKINEEDMDLYDHRICGAMGNALAILSEYGATASTLVVRGSPVHAIIKQIATEREADVILMGTHGRRGLARTLRGSVTENVMRVTDVPVIAIRESAGATFRPLIQ